ncbi:hypothetical protein HS041_18055 [Planomonospora sp. ID67723]|uniref:hypothetical protein n=1 Tax=Planomonospora sp. ID67723 TaxID=2738134 RepID=UPI0018C395C4|nr:hypothetical protein [Planomonospora sp. ID67723]MBG0829671.1 hypothetical protein [Planomonospora sp. ID67723]
MDGISGTSRNTGTSQRHLGGTSTTGAGLRTMPARSGASMAGEPLIQQPDRAPEQKAAPSAGRLVAGDLTT